MRILGQLTHGIVDRGIGDTHVAIERFAHLRIPTRFVLLDALVPISNCLLLLAIMLLNCRAGGDYRSSAAAQESTNANRSPQRYHEHDHRCGSSKPWQR